LGKKSEKKLSLLAGKIFLSKRYCAFKRDQKKSKKIKSFGWEKYFLVYDIALLKEIKKKSKKN